MIPIFLEMGDFPVLTGSNPIVLMNLSYLYVIGDLTSSTSNVKQVSSLTKEARALILNCSLIALSVIEFCLLIIMLVFKTCLVAISNC